MATVLRSDESHNPSYPPTPDSRGTARVYYLRKPYYLGSHDSPLSYVMFGIWKHHLVTEGKIPPTAQIREKADAVLNADQKPSKRWHRNLVMGLALTLSMLVGGVLGASFRSTQDSIHVDGKALSASEMAFVRNFRAGVEKRMAQRQVDEEVATQLFAAIQEGRLTDNEIHKRIWGY